MRRIHGLVRLEDERARVGNYAAVVAMETHDARIVGTVALLVEHAREDVPGGGLDHDAGQSCSPEPGKPSGGK